MTGIFTRFLGMELLTKSELDWSLLGTEFPKNTGFYRKILPVNVVSGFWVNCSFVLDSTHSKFKYQSLGVLNV